MDLITLTPKNNFNPRSPTRGATVKHSMVVIDAEFQSTLPYAGSDLMPCTVWQRLPFQSTLPYAGSDTRDRLKRNIAIISIHAPLRGERQATQYIRL